MEVFLRETTTHSPMPYCSRRLSSYNFLPNIICLARKEVHKVLASEVEALFLVDLATVSNKYHGLCLSSSKRDEE